MDGAFGGKYRGTGSGGGRTDKMPHGPSVFNSRIVFYIFENPLYTLTPVFDSGCGGEPNVGRLLHGHLESHPGGITGKRAKRESKNDDI